MSVKFKDSDYSENIKYVKLVNALYNGTREISNGGYLKKFQLEKDTDYLDRIENATLYNFFRKTVDNLSSAIFRKDLKLDYKVKNEDLVKNVDGLGTSLTQLMKTAAKHSLIDGISYIWVDSQKLDSNEQNSASVLSAHSLRPFMKIIKREEVINKTITHENGYAEISQVVISQVITVPKNNSRFETVDKEVFVILTKFGGEVIEIVNDKEVTISSWENKLGIVPLIPVYSSKAGFLEADIPLLDLAYMNIKHYNKQSNIDTLLKIAAVPVPVMFVENEFDQNTLKRDGVTVGATTALIFSDKNSQGFEFVEIQGSSISALQEDIAHTEEIMEKLSLSVLTNKTFNTATEAKIANNNSSLFLVELASSLESAFNTAYKLFKLYTGNDAGISITINKDFNGLAIDAQTIDKYIALKRDNLISIDTFWEALIKGEILDIPDFDKEKQKIKDETIAL